MKRFAMVFLALAWACSGSGSPGTDLGGTDLGGTDPVPVLDRGPGDRGPGDPGPSTDPGSADLGPADQGPSDEAPADPGATPDVAPSDPGTTPDAGPQPPAAGELGGACGAADACNGGTCQTLPGAGQPVCTKECLQNRDCPDNLRCEAVDVSTMACLFGPRGTGGIGAPCGAGKGNGCASGLCIDADPVEGIPVDTCTAACEGGADCKAPFPTCFYDLCLPVLSGYLGGLCGTQAPECEPDEGTCVDLGGDGKRCTKACTATADCGPAEYLECRAAGDGKYCLVKAS